MCPVLFILNSKSREASESWTAMAASLPYQFSISVTPFAGLPAVMAAYFTNIESQQGGTLPALPPVLNLSTATQSFASNVGGMTLQLGDTSYAVPPYVFDYSLGQSQGDCSIRGAPDDVPCQQLGDYLTPDSLWQVATTLTGAMPCLEGKWDGVCGCSADGCTQAVVVTSMLPFAWEAWQADWAAIQAAMRQLVNDNLIEILQKLRFKLPHGVETQIEPMVFGDDALYSTGWEECEAQMTPGFQIRAVSMSGLLAASNGPSS